MSTDLYKVHEDVPEALHVISPALLDPKVSVDAGVPGGSCEVLVFPVGDVLVGARVPELLGQPEVYHIHEVALLAETHQEVVWLHVAVDEVLPVNELNAADLKTRVTIKRMSRL